MCICEHGTGCLVDAGLDPNSGGSDIQTMDRKVRRWDRSRNPLPHPPPACLSYIVTVISSSEFTVVSLSHSLWWWWCGLQSNVYPKPPPLAAQSPAV